MVIGLHSLYAALWTMSLVKQGFHTTRLVYMLAYQCQIGRCYSILNNWLRHANYKISVFGHVGSQLDHDLIQELTMCAWQVNTCLESK